MENSMDRTINTARSIKIQGEGLESILFEVSYAGCKEVFTSGFALI